MWVGFSVCGLRIDPDTKQEGKLNVEIITFRTTHEPIKYLSLFHFYAQKKKPINRNLIVLSHLFYLTLYELTLLMTLFFSRWYTRKLS